MRILMTGATGLIGREVGKLLAEKGIQLNVVSRSPGRARLELPFPAEIFEWQGESDVFPSKALDDVDLVLHLAGEPVASGRWTIEKKKAIYDSRVLGTKRLVEAISKNPGKISALVAGSATGLYGDRGDDVQTENARPADDFLSKVVVDWEKEIDAFTDITGKRSVKIRTGIVLARHGGALEKLIPIFQKGLGGRLANGQQWMSWIHLEDIARLFVYAIENDVSGVFNGTSPEPARNERFTVALARALGRPVFLPVPASALKIAYGEMSTALLGSQRVLPERALTAGFDFRYPELVRALNEICEPLRDGQHEMFNEQWVDRTPDEVFPYFCSEKNLEELTPTFLNFRVIGKSTAEIQEGTLIDYRLSLHGVPMKWRTRIEEWKPGRAFVDVQLKGPYRKWHHTHEFVPFAGGTLMRDRVLYKLPLGWFGDTAASWKVTGQVGEIFAFRRKKIGELFGSSRSGGSTK